jgi:hypothetical protein
MRVDFRNIFFQKEPTILRATFTTLLLNYLEKVEVLKNNNRKPNKRTAKVVHKALEVMEGTTSTSIRILIQGHYK